MIGDYLKKLRDSRGWSQTALAARAGVSQQLITRIENNKIRETRKLVLIAKAFDMTVEQLLSGAGEPPRSAEPSRPAYLPGWPFSFEKARFDALPRHTKALIEGFIRAEIQRFEQAAGSKKKPAQRAAASRRLGS